MSDHDDTDGASGQDRESYTDDQDRESYTVSVEDEDDDLEETIASTNVSLPETNWLEPYREIVRGTRDPRIKWDNERDTASEQGQSIIEERKEVNLA